jgi:hydrogenase nickel incorporation protein HypA/HybF
MSLMFVFVAGASTCWAKSFYFPIAAVDTVAAGAELVINRVGLRVICDDCGTTCSAQTLVASCPFCGSSARTILAGREMRVVSFDAK